MFYKFPTPLHIYVPKHWLRTFLLTSWLLALASTTKAGLIDEHSWTAESDDGKYILVQLLAHPEKTESEDLEGVKLREKYPASGVYLNNDSNELLWKLPYHPIAYRVYFSSDGNHIILAHEDDSHTISNIPVGAHIFFHHKGGQHQYRNANDFSWGWITKRLTNKLLRREYYNWQKATYSPTHMTYTIKTNQAEEFTFNIYTGKIISIRSLWNKAAIIFLIVVPVLVWGIFKIRLIFSINTKISKQKILRISLREIFLLITFTSLILFLATLSGFLALGISIIAIFGAIMSWLISGKRSSWLPAGILAVYGTGLSILLYSTLGESLIRYAVFPRIYPPAVFIRPLLVALIASGCISGGLLAGYLEKKLSNPTET